MKSETVKTKSCRVEENTFMSTDHKAVFMETHTSREEEKHTNKTNIKQRKRSPQWGEKSEDPKNWKQRERDERNWSTTSGQVQTNRVSDNDEETGRVLVADDTGKDQVRILLDSVRAKQPPATSITQHLDDNRKAKAWSIPLFAAQLGLKILLDHADRNQALKTMKSTERTRSRQTAPGMDLKTVRATQLTNEVWTLRVEKIKTTRRLPHGAPEKPMVFT